MDINKKYQSMYDPEPQKRPEDSEDRIIRRSRRIFNAIISIAGIIMLIMLIYGIILRLT